MIKTLIMTVFTDRLQCYCNPFCIQLTRWSEQNRIGGDVQDDFHDDLHNDPDLHDDLHDDDHQGVDQVTTNEDGSAGGVTPVRSQCHQIRWDQTNGRPAQPTPSFFLAQEQKLKWPSTKNLSSRGFFIKWGEQTEILTFDLGSNAFTDFSWHFPIRANEVLGTSPFVITSHEKLLLTFLFWRKKCSVNEQWYVLTAQYFPRQFRV